MRVKANPPAALPPAGAKPKEKKDKKARKDKRTGGSKVRHMCTDVHMALGRRTSNGLIYCLQHRVLT